MKLESGGLFDVECRDAKNGDGAFLTVAKGKGKSLSELPKTFFTDALFSSTGRFSFYGAPTDIKVKKSEMDGNYRIIELVFSNLSQSTNAGKSVFVLFHHVHLCVQYAIMIIWLLI